MLDYDAASLQCSAAATGIYRDYPSEHLEAHAPQRTSSAVLTPILGSVSVAHTTRRCKARFVPSASYMCAMTYQLITSIWTLTVSATECILLSVSADSTLHYYRVAGEVLHLCKALQSALPLSRRCKLDWHNNITVKCSKCLSG